MFSPQQIEAMQKALELLGEHFPNVLIAVRTDVEDDPDREATNVIWRGSRITAMGLASNAAAILTRRIEPS
jgi:hypothetical protein